MGMHVSYLEKKSPYQDEKPQVVPFADVNKFSPLEEKELKATYQMMQENMKKRERTLQKTMEPIDNSGYSYDYKPVKLPLDGEGYVQTFDVKETEAYTDFFNKYGVVVVRDVLAEEECKKSEDEVWDFLGRLSKGKIKKENPDTWKRWAPLANLGILGNDTILSKQCCKNRQNPLIYEVFKNLLGADELHCVVGRSSAMRPTVKVKFSDGEKDMPEWRTIKNWLHWDMNPWTGWTTDFGFKELDRSLNRGYDKVKVQGWVSLVDCGPNDGGFHCIPGFANHIRGWAHLNQKEHFKSDDFRSTLQVPKEDKIRDDCQKVPVRAGCLVIWSSKTPHGTFPNTSEHGRMIQYIKMSDANDKSIAPLFCCKDLLPNDFELTELGEKLFGFKSWK